MKLLFLCTIVVLLFSGCAPKIVEVTVYKEVKVPIKCNIRLQDKPKSDEYDAYYLKNILIYTEKIRNDLNYCITGNFLIEDEKSEK